MTHVALSDNEFKARIKGFSHRLSDLGTKSDHLQEQVSGILKKLKYDET
jgi:hypothetical protein